MGKYRWGLAVCLAACLTVGCVIPGGGAGDEGDGETETHGRFVAVGKGVIAVSTDGGSTWERESMFENHQIKRIVYGDGIYLATGAELDDSRRPGDHDVPGSHWLRRRNLRHHERRRRLPHLS